MNTIEKFIRTEIEWYKGIFARRIEIRKMKANQIALQEAKYFADQKTLSTGIKHWVVNDNGQYLILNRRDIINLKKAGRLDKNAGGSDFDREALYTTQIVSHRMIEKGSRYKPEDVKINPVRRFVKLVFNW